MKRINNRGSHTIEYAIVLACIVSVAATFFSGDNFKNILDKTMGSIVTLLGGSSNMLAGNTKSFVNVALRGDQTTASTELDEHVAVAGRNSTDGNMELIQLDSNQEYELVIDLQGFEAAGITDINKLGACILLWEANKPDYKANLDSGDILFGETKKEQYSCDRLNIDSNPYKDSLVTVSRDRENNTMTCTFTTKDNAFFGMNLTYKKYIADQATKDEMQIIADNYSKYVTLQKVTK